MINWGFLGAGYIASQALAPAVHAATAAAAAAAVKGTTSWILVTYQST